jgi:CheY-like chemotaxis protein/HPt (histidine-containing phosphotransfer) domain-containing protein
VALGTDLTLEQRDCLLTVKSSAEALLGILNDVLDFAKVEAGRMDLSPAPFRVRDGLADMLKPLAVRADARGLELDWHVAAAVPDCLLLDSGRLRQVVSNLVGNALKFTEAGRVDVTVEAGPAGPGEVELRLAVKDTGIGVAPDKLQTIFEPFVQADGSMTRKYGGTGLGLTISRRLSRLMGGHAWAESTPGRGSTFFFTARGLVVEDDKVTRWQGDKVTEEEAGPPVTLSSPLRVLLAEDHPVNQQVAALLLQRLGHSVAIVGSGRAALAALAAEAFDLVLMDVQMPDLDGLEATAALREREKSTGRRVPVIALTAHAMKGDRERCLAAGMDAYLTKPLQPEALRQALRGLCGGVGHQPGGPVLDRAAFLARVGGQVGLVRQVVEMFEADWPRRVAALRGALAAEDAAGLAKIAHGAVGALGALAAQEAVGTASRLEALARGGDLASVAGSLAELERQGERLRAALAELVREG